MEPKRLLLPIFLASAIAISCRGPAGPAGPPGPPASPTPPVSPTPGPTPGVGLAMSIDAAAIANDGTVTVDFSLADDAGNPRPLDGVQLFWTLAAMTHDAASNTTGWNAYLTKAASGVYGSTQQPTYDATGTYETLGAGSFRYTFTAPIAAGFDATATHRVGAWAQMSDGADGELSVDGTFDFVPAGGTPSEERSIVATDACNTCHSPLSAHGGARKATELCATCHTRQLVDPDTEDPAIPGDANPLELSVLVHRIHEGKNLPSLVAAAGAGLVGEKYSVIGYQGRESVYGETLAPFPGTTAVRTDGVGFPQAITNCATCHQGAQKETGWTLASRRDTCESCHDTTWFGDPLATPPRMVAHAGGPMSDDTNCITCHPGATGNEYDLSVEGAHVTPLKSKQLRGLVAKIDSVTLVTGTNGQTPTVVFEVRNGDDGSAVNPLTSPNLSSLSIVFGGSNGDDFDYQYFSSTSVASLAAFDSTDGSYSVTLPPRAGTDPYWPGAAVVPPGASGTWAAGIEARRSVNVVGQPSAVVEAAFNPVTYFAVDGGNVAKRRDVVAMSKCNQCHDLLNLHGGQRQNSEYCVVCHNPTATDWNRRPKTGGNVNIAATIDGLEERSINFKDMIHRIHTGDGLSETPYVVYGFGGSVNEFDGVKFPGDRAKCETCHQPGTYTVDAITPDDLPTIANETGTVMHLATLKHQPGEPVRLPLTAACQGCHDASDARAHYAAMTSGGVETCSVCHSEDDAFSVTKMHAGK